MIRVGIMDKEELYVGKLAAYLNRRNKGKIQCNAYTEEDKLLTGIDRQGFQVVLSTEKKLLEQITRQQEKICCVWLTETEEKDRMYCICRYQSGTVIMETLNRILDREGLCMGQDRKVIAVYSPIGRCGKTTLLLDYVGSCTDSQWLYIGMEDYGAVEGQMADTLLYYTKERRREKVLEQIEGCSGKIVSPFSPFDSKTVNREDMIWLSELLKQQTRYQGILFDIGTGVLEEIGVLTVFDQVIVPYLPGEISDRKREHFVQLVKAYGMEEWLEQVGFLDMNHTDAFASMVE